MNSTFDGNAVRKEEAVEDGKVTPMPVQKTETKKKPAKAAAKAETAEVPEMEESKSTVLALSRLMCIVHCSGFSAI